MSHIKAQIQHFISTASASWAQPEPGQAAAFERLALQLFDHQTAHNHAYSQWVASHGIAAGSITRWQEIPPLPTDAFKVADLATCAPEDAAAIFQTSGTTHGERGRHIFPEVETYRLALHEPFRRFLMPDVRPGGMIFVNLCPTPGHAPDSSLGFMVDDMAQRYASPASVAFQRGGSLDVAEVWRHLSSLGSSGPPVLLLGTAFAWVHLVDHAAGRRIALPAGSRLMQTGGFKGRSRTISRAQLRDSLVQTLGLSEAYIVGEYGMTELSSQLYEGSLRAAVLGDDAGPGYLAPPWMRVSIRDPQTLGMLADGEVGMVAFYDLANVGSVASIVTSDLGRLLPSGGLELLGRAEGAQLRGCSLQVEELLEAVKG